MQKVYELIVPETVEAVQLTRDNLQWVTLWCKGAKREGISRDDGRVVLTGINVPGLRSIETAFFGDYIVKKRCGDFTVKEAHAFESKYRQVAE